MTKWAVRRINDTSRPFAVIDDEGDIVCGSVTQEHAEIIVDTVNAKDEMIVALRHALSLVNELTKALGLMEEIDDACIEKFKPLSR